MKSRSRAVQNSFGSRSTMRRSRTVLGAVSSHTEHRGTRDLLQLDEVVAVDHHEREAPLAHRGPLRSWATRHEDSLGRRADLGTGTRAKVRRGRSVHWRSSSDAIAQLSPRRRLSSPSPAIRVGRAPRRGPLPHSSALGRSVSNTIDNPNRRSGRGRSTCVTEHGRDTARVVPPYRRVEGTHWHRRRGWEHPTMRRYRSCSRCTVTPHSEVRREQTDLVGSVPQGTR